MVVTAAPKVGGLRGGSSLEFNNVEFLLADESHLSGIAKTCQTKICC
jgi:hypothetical protein